VLDDLLYFQQSAAWHSECYFADMQHKTSLTLTLAFICQIAASQCPTSQAQRSAAQPTPKLKWVELDGRYKIQVPDDFTLGRIDPKIAAVPAFYFNANPPENTSIQVFLLPKVGLYQTDPKTGVPQIEIDGTSLQRSFKISEGIVVYYGWSVNDNAHECSMNSPCPVRVPRNRRYGTLYVFAAFDDAHNTIVEFRGDHLGATQKITGLYGDGKLLREVVVPSLSSIQ